MNKKKLYKYYSKYLLYSMEQVKNNILVNLVFQKKKIKL